MSKFDQAMAKAGAAKAKVAPKAKTGAAAAPKMASTSAKGPELKTLEDKKKFVAKHEIKMEDLQDSINNETKKDAKKPMENDLKKMQKDETYLKCKEDIREAEAQAVKDAERAALAAKDDKKSSKSASKDDKKDKEQPTVKLEKAEASAMADIDAAFAGTGKDAGAAKEKAVSQMEGFSASTPFMLPRLDKLIPLFDNSKLAAPAAKAARAIVENATPNGHGIAAVAVPLLLAGMDDKKWKVKAGCIDLLVPCLRQMESTPAQLAQTLPLIVPKLAEAALEVRAEIRTATGGVLRQIGSLVASPEIKKLSSELVTALAEPTNQKHTQGVLTKMASQTFLSLIDPASLSLLMPVIVRGLKERDSMSKKWSAQIFGATSMLVSDMDSITPYLKSVMPLLQASLTDPVAEVQREAAKAFGVLEQVLPDYSRQNNQPWLFGKLRHGEIGEQLGSALALAEVFTKMQKDVQTKFLPQLELGAGDEKASVRRGFLELMELMPHAMKMDFVPFISKLFPKMLLGITGDKDKDADAGLNAATSLVARFGDLCPHLLLPGFEAVYAACLEGESSEEKARLLVARDKTAMLLGKLADKILEHKRFGQDLLSTEDCSNKDTREYVLLLISIMKYDADASVKRYSNGAWKSCGGAPKMQKAIMPSLEKLLLRMRAGELGLGMQKLAAKIVEELTKAGDMEAPSGDEPAPANRYAIPTPEGLDASSDEATIATGGTPLEVAGEAVLRQVSGDDLDVLAQQASFSSVPADVLNHCNVVALSVVKEGRKKKASGPKIAAGIAEQLEAVLQCLTDSDKPSNVDFPTVSEAVARGVMGSSYDMIHGSGDDDEAEVLLRVENLMLMYGGGKLLLKDTTLEMKKNCCYGVVGQNGAGKTTLMKEIATHRIVGMPAELKCVHVDDSKLSLMSKSSLNTIEYCMKMAKDIGVDFELEKAKATLTEVGFAESALQEPVSELSTGWRMRLTLGVSMLKHADLVLLDEPTNHLDEQSVEWLGHYIKSIADSSVMVISHEPKFLDKIVTHIVAYVDKKLEYTRGDFQAFAASRGLTKEQIDAMLSGNLSFDTKNKDDEDDDDAPLQVSGPAKLSFPIPGTMEGIKSGSRAVLESKDASFRWASGKDYLINCVSVKATLSSRVAICGRNGCGKSTLMSVLCSEMSPSENSNGQFGEVWRHHNLRLGYLKQDHLTALGPFFDTSSFVYITTRFKDGYDGDLQRRLITPESDEEAERRAKLAKEMGKYGNPVEDLVSRSKNGTQLTYEVKWAGLDDPKQNTLEPISKLRAMGLEKVVIACDERIAAKAAGLDQRPLTRREIVRHVEAFGIDEEMCCNQLVKGFSAGQKVRLSMAAMFWTKPHLICLDEPTNYLDVETVEALAKALINFRGGIVMIEPKTDFVDKICNEKWHLEDGSVRTEKLNNGVKRAA